MTNDSTPSESTANIVPVTTDLSQAPKVSPGLKINNLNDLERLSKLLATSRFFQDAKESAQCAVKVLAGMELGLGAFQSMTGIHIIGGKPSIGAGLMASRLKSSEKYDYETLLHTDEQCLIAVFESEFKHDVRSLKRRMTSGEISREQYCQSIESISLGVSSFTVEDAKRAGTQNMGKFPRNMLFARCISNAIRWYAPDVFSTPVYTPDELNGDSGDGSAHTVESSPIDVSKRVVQQRDSEPSVKNAIVDSDVPPHLQPGEHSTRSQSPARKDLFHMISKKLEAMDISKEGARIIVMDLFGKPDGASLTNDELSSFLHYLDTGISPDIPDDLSHRSIQVDVD